MEEEDIVDEVLSVVTLILVEEKETAMKTFVKKISPERFKYDVGFSNLMKEH